jgi:hypothetical protein
MGRSWLPLPLGLLLLSLGCLLVYSLVVLWPAAQDWAVNPKPGKPPTVTWLGGSFTPSDETALRLVVVLAGALGGYLYALVWFGDDVGNRLLRRASIWWYLLRLVVGAALALIAYLVAHGLLLRGTDVGGLLNPAGVAGMAGAIGLCATQAGNWLPDRTARTLRRAVAFAKREPSLSGVEPAGVRPGGRPAFELRGRGFVSGSQVYVSVPGGADVLRPCEPKSAQTLVVTLLRDDVATAGLLSFRVVNPEPGGRTSATKTVDVA